MEKSQSTQREKRGVATKKRHTMKIALLAAIAAGSLFFAVLYATYTSADEGYAIHIVQSGETIWSIAARYADDRDDLRRLVYDIAALNNAPRGGLIRFGDTLIIPNR